MKKITWFVAILLVTSLIFTFVGCKDPEPILDTTPPAEVTELTITASNGNALLSWKNPVDEDFDGVKISMNPPEGTLKNAVILGKEVTSFELSGLENGKEYTFIIKTFDTSLNYSKETIESVSVIDTSDKTAPAEVTELAATNKDSSVLLTWKDATDNDILGYEVSWDKSTSINRTIVMKSNSIMVAPGSQGCYISNLLNGTKYTFTVKSLDTSGNKSEGQIVSITPSIIEKSSLVIKLIPSIIEKTKENVEISVKVTTDSASVIKKIAYKEGTVINTEEVLAGTDITVTPKIIADKNTTYTVVAADTAGRREIKWITVDNIDFDPPAQVSDFNAVYDKDKRIISVSWINPTDEDFAGTILTYKKRNSTDITTFEFDKNTGSTQIENILNDDTEYILSIKTKDGLDNISSAKTTTVIADNTLCLTINAGKGWLETETENKVKSITVEFEAGESFYQIYERNDWDYYSEKNEEKDIWYAYEENGNYYDYDYELIDKEGKILSEDEWLGMSLYEDTTFYLYYRKLVPITFDFNGGKSKYNNSDYSIEYQLEGLEFEPNADPYKEGYFLRGWTLTPNGDNYVTIIPSNSTILYAKWEKSKTCTVTLKSGEYSKFYDYSNDTQLSSTMSLTFESGKSLERVLEENGYYSNAIVDESEILGKRFGGFRDSQGNVYDMDTMLTESVELEAFTRDLYSYEVGINMNFNGINIEGYDQYCAYMEIDEYKEYLEELAENIQDDVEDYFFVGWTYTKDGDDFVDSLKGGTTTTIYAKWMSSDAMAEILPYYYSDDKTQLTFIFRPADFNLSWSSDITYTVKLMTMANDWNTSNEDYNFTKNIDGNYTLTLNEISSKFIEWQGFDFYVSETDRWYGWTDYIHTLPKKFTMLEYGEDSSFKLELLSTMSLTIDPNEGNFYGDSSANVIEVEMDEYHRWYSTYDINNAISDLVIQNPTKDGYVFAGWTLTKDGNDFIDYKYNRLPYGNYTLYAKWLKGDTCTLTLVAKNSEFVNSKGISLGNTIELSFVLGQTLSEIFSENDLNFSSCLKSYEKDGAYYTFNSSFTSNTDEYIYSEGTVLKESVTLTPIFETGLTIAELQSNGGYFYVNGETFEGVGSYFKSLTSSIPQRNNYYFGGWTVTPNGEDYITQDDEAYYVSINSPILYAKWLNVTEVLGQATWYYLDIPKDAKNVIFNSNGNQTIDITGIDVSSGSIYYAWDSTVPHFEANTSLIYEPYDKPEGQPGRVWCYTNSTSVPNCNWWGCTSVSDDAQWPGKPMTKEGELPSEEYTFTIKSIEVVDAPDISTAGYYAFCEGWIPNNNWDATNKVTSKTGNNIVFEVNCDYTSIVPATIPIQILNPSSDGAFWYEESKVGGGTLSVEIPSDCDGKTYVWKIYANEDYRSELVEVTE